MLRFVYAGVFCAVVGVVATGCGDSQDKPNDSTSKPKAGEGGDREPEAGSGEAGRGGSTGGEAGGGSGGRGGSGGGGTGGAGGSGGKNPLEDDGGMSMTEPDPSDELYDPARLPRFDLELSEDAMAALTADPDVYVRGTLRYGDTTLSEIGVRLKGEGTFRNLQQKPAFKLKFDEFVDKQAFRGLRRMTFNNLVEDKSYLAERLSYYMYRTAKLPAPRCNNALVYLNGVYLGVYANVENEDKTFLRRWFTSDAGNLYEEGQTDFVVGREALFELETNEERNDRSDLTKLFEALNDSTSATFLRDLDTSLDTDHYLRFTAMEAAVNQWDMYSYTMFYPNNMRLYHDPATQRFVFLPWGMDLSMKPFVYTKRPHIPIFEPVHYEDNPAQHVTNGLIFQKCLASPDCKSKYIQIVRETATKFDAANLDDLAEQYHEQIKSHVYAETRKEMSNADFDTAHQVLLQTIRARTAAIMADLQAE